MKHVRYQSAGNTVGLEENIDDYWEMLEDGYVQRSIQILPNGEVLKYDRTHAADKFSVLPEGIISDEHLADASYGKITTITLEEFENRWSQKAVNWD